MARLSKRQRAIREKVDSTRLYGIDEAVALQRRLTDFAAASAPPAALAELRRRLASYERGEPERAPWLR